MTGSTVDRQRLILALVGAALDRHRRVVGCLGIADDLTDARGQAEIGVALGVDAHDGLSIAAAQVHPAFGPVHFHSVHRIHLVS